MISDLILTKLMIYFQKGEMMRLSFSSQKTISKIYSRLMKSIHKELKKRFKKMFRFLMKLIMVSNTCKILNLKLKRFYYR